MAEWSFLAGRAFKVSSELDFFKVQLQLSLIFADRNSGHPNVVSCLDINSSGPKTP